MAKSKPYNEKNDKPQDKEDTQGLTTKGKKAFKKADKKQPKSTKKTMKEDNAWDEAKIKKIAKKPGMSKKK
jgi:3-oxoacyl-[acyl-carrier-protein] synthase III